MRGGSAVGEDRSPARQRIGYISDIHLFHLLRNKKASSEEAIDKVIHSIEAGRYIWIENMDVTPLYPEPDERGFRTE